MSREMESMWDAMKSVHYQRTIEKLELSIRDVRDLEGALTAALDTVVETIHAVAGTLWYYDQFGDGRIRPRVVYGGGDLQGISLLPGEGIAGQVIQSGKPLVIGDCQKDPRWAGKVDSKTGFRTESMICVPMIVSSVVFGCIQIINKTDHVAFDEKDMTFTQELANAAAALFQRRGLLDSYLTAAGEVTQKKPNEISFTQIFTAPNDQEMEWLLRQVENFAALHVNEQNEVLKLARAMRPYFVRQTRRSARWGLFNRP